MEENILKEIKDIEEEGERIVKEAEEFAKNLIIQKNKESQIEIEKFKKELEKIKEERIREVVEEINKIKEIKQKEIEEKIKDLEEKAKKNRVKVMEYLKNKFFEIWQLPE